MKKNCNNKCSEVIYLVKIVQNRGSARKVLIIVPSVERFLQNLADILQIGSSIIFPKFISLRRRISKLCKKFIGGYFFWPPCIYIGI